MKHGSLFSGIGGFDLAAEWMGWENVFHCEWNPFGQKVLKHYWPKAESFNDITKSDFTKYANTIDILTGGFPCQPYSSAGKRLGKEDERHLWPEMLRAIREIAPRFVVGENVRGLTNWNGGLVFDEVCAELENLGYQVAPVVIPACGVNAPHKRERIWFVAANTKCKPTRSDRGTNDEAQGDVWRGNTGDVFGTLCNSGVTTNTNGTGGAKDNGNRKPRFNDQKSTPNNWDNFPTQSPICGGDDGLPRQLDNITFSNWRQESIKGYGNAIVPQVALEIFKAIERVDNEML
jgi:DNA (cytosine-5)-methyltransferase 1